MLRCGRACARTQTVKEQWSGLASNKLSAVLVHRFKLANQIVNGRLTFHSGVREKILSNRIKIMAFSNDKRHHRAALHHVRLCSRTSYVPIWSRTHLGGVVTSVCQITNHRTSVTIAVKVHFFCGTGFQTKKITAQLESSKFDSAPRVLYFIRCFHWLTLSAQMMHTPGAKIIGRNDWL